jgi:hypothetical protein
MFVPGDVFGGNLIGAAGGKIQNCPLNDSSSPPCHGRLKTMNGNKQAINNTEMRNRPFPSVLGRDPKGRVQPPLAIHTTRF